MLATTIATILFTEHEDGFRVKNTGYLAPKVAQTDQYSEEQTAYPGRLFFMTVFSIESASSGKRSNMGIQLSSFGEASRFAALNEYARKAKSSQDGIIKELNEA